MENRDYIFQVIDITVANGTGAGIQSSNQRFNSGYDRLEGIALIEKENGGNASEYEVGFDLSAENLTVQSVHHSLYEFAPATPSSDRFAKMNAQAAGSEFTVNTKLLAAATADLKYQLVLKLSRPNKENC